MNIELWNSPPFQVVNPTRIPCSWCVCVEASTPSCATYCNGCKQGSSLD